MKISSTVFLLYALVLPNGLLADVVGTPGHAEGPDRRGEDLAPQQPPSTQTLSLEAENCTVTGGFIETHSDGRTFVHQITTVDDTSRGKLACVFTVTDPDTYRITAEVFAPGANADSFYVGLDQPPVTTSPDDIWDLQVQAFANWEELDLSKRGPYGDHVSPQYNPFTVTLAAGQHTLYIWAREAGAGLNKLAFHQHDQSESPPPPPPIAQQPEAPVSADAEFACDGTQDAAGIEAAVNAVGSGKLLGLTGTSNCDIDQPISITTTGVTLDGNGRTLKWRGPHVAKQEQIEIRAANVTLRNLVVEGDGDGDGYGDACRGIEIYGNAALVDRVTVQNIWEPLGRGCSTDQEWSPAAGIWINDASNVTLQNSTVKNIICVNRDTSKPFSQQTSPCRGIEAREAQGFRMLDVNVENVVGQIDGDCVRIKSGTNSASGDAYSTSISQSRAAYWDGGGAKDCTDRMIKLEASDFDVRNITYTATYLERFYQGNTKWPIENRSTILMIRDCDGCDVENVTLKVAASQPASGTEYDGKNITFTNVDVIGISLPNCTSRTNCTVVNTVSPWNGAYCFQHSPRSNTVVGDDTLRNLAIDGLSCIDHPTQDVLKNNSIELPNRYGGRGTDLTIANLCTDTAINIDSGYNGTWVGDANYYETGYINGGTWFGAGAKNKGGAACAVRPKN